MKFDARSRWFAAIVAALALASFFWWRAHRQPIVAAQDVAPAVTTSAARFGSIDVTVPAVGRLGPAAGAESRLAFATSGRIASIAVHVGERVTAGDALASLDTTSLVLAARQASADARAASAQAAGVAIDRFSTKIAVDEQAVARAQRLYAAGVAARKDIASAQAQLAVDRAESRGAGASAEAGRAQSASAAAKAAMANRDLENGTLHSPIDGVVTAVLHSRGESVDATIPVVAIAPGENSQVALQLAASDAARVHAGDIVRLAVPSAGNTIVGRVSGVAGSADPTTQSAQVLVSASVPAALSGSAVDAQIVVAHDRGILVPKTSVIADPATGRTLVFVRGKNKDADTVFNDREVRVIFEDDKIAEVTGLRVGETIASEGAFQLLAPSGGR
ncbi:MAG: HlyD family efflux transporter periplasmic adaptor subunit [Candidatus Eremiobacteraeota bacterium]|nr:HlyD family efflux transporter periplasmic adaptor subunit [Candidatus Eremiobacteraeota bacterium]